MLWTVVYDFFVKYVFGGRDSTGTIYSALMGYVYNPSNQTYTAVNTDNGISVFKYYSPFFGGDVYLSLGNYFSLIATIVSMVVIVVLACLFIKKIYNMVAHVIA